MLSIASSVDIFTHRRHIEGVPAIIFPLTGIWTREKYPYLASQKTGLSRLVLVAGHRVEIPYSLVPVRHLWGQGRSGVGTTTVTVKQAERARVF